MTESRATDWPTLMLLLAMYVVLIGNFTLYLLVPGPLLLHIAISAIAIHLSFTVWHEGVHLNPSPRRWLSDAVGILGVFPYMAPYYVERWFHLEHHVRLNQPDDPNAIYTAGPFWKIATRYPRILRFARERMVNDPRTPAEKRLDAIPIGLIALLYAVAWWSGVFTDLVLLWFVPLVIAKVVMDWYISYVPHVGLPPHRFHGTRILDIAWLTPLLLCHNYHAIHHLWPDIPWHRYRRVFREKLEYLREHGVPIEHRVVGFAPGARRVEGNSPSSG